jgi:hypothetical protein
LLAELFREFTLEPGPSMHNLRKGFAHENILTRAHGLAHDGTPDLRDIRTEVFFGNNQDCGGYAGVTCKDVPRASDGGGFFAEWIHDERLHPIAGYTDQVREHSLVEPRNTDRMTCSDVKKSVEETVGAAVNGVALQPIEECADVSL